MQYVFLNKNFYNIFNHLKYPEILQKTNRPYILIKININGIDFGLPLRSSIAHENVYWTNKKNKCGVDFSKAVIIKPEYIDTTQNPRVRADEHNMLKGKEYIIIKKFQSYIKKYKKAIENIHIEKNKNLCAFSTLKYYHSELGI